MVRYIHTGTFYQYLGQYLLEKKDFVLVPLRFLCFLCISGLPLSAGWGLCVEPSPSEQQPVPAPPEQSSPLTAAIPVQVGCLICSHNKIHLKCTLRERKRRGMTTWEVYRASLSLYFRLQSAAAHREQPQAAESSRNAVGRQQRQVKANSCSSWK